MTQVGQPLIATACQSDEALVFEDDSTVVGRKEPLQIKALRWLGYRGASVLSDEAARRHLVSAILSTEIRALFTIVR